MLNRRNFLKKIGAVCAGAVAIPVAVVAAKKETPKWKQYAASFNRVEAENIRIGLKKETAYGMPYWTGAD